MSSRRDTVIKIKKTHVYYFSDRQDTRGSRKLGAIRILSCDDTDFVHGYVFQATNITTLKFHIRACTNLSQIIHLAFKI